jgi:coenzyme F420 hydrogenase subunit beta
MRGDSMKSLRILNVLDVAETHMCLGCGACAYVAQDELEMCDVLQQGRRPVAKKLLRGEGVIRALDVCPGIELSHAFDEEAPGLLKNLTAAWGPIVELWEGFACDPDIRFAGSSGGAASALALYCVEQAQMHGVLHIAARQDVPYLNETVMSCSREELLARTGSRYAPASPCDGLQKVEDAPAPCAFIGKPCDVAGANKAAALRPKLAEKLGLTIGIFCAGTPSTEGTLEMLRAMGIDPQDLISLRYRGNGWPGKATAIARDQDGSESSREMTYAQSWGEILQKHRQWRCHVCVDHTGEFADIAVGDPWYRPIPPGEPGRSLVVARTERGRRIIHEAMSAGYLRLERASPDVLEASQPGFPIVRGSVWGRLWTCRLFGVATPRYHQMPMFRFWWSKLSLKEKLQSIYGTIKRIHRRGLRRRVRNIAHDPAPANQPLEASANV